MPSSAPLLIPIQLVKLPTLNLARKTLSIPDIIVATFPTFKVCLMIAYGALVGISHVPL
jgi:hypothetical protein